MLKNFEQGGAGQNFFQFEKHSLPLLVVRAMK